MLKELSPGWTDFTVTIFKILQISNNVQLCRSELKSPSRSSQDIKGLSGHGKAILQLYKVLTKLGILNGQFFKDRNIGKFACHEGKGSFVVDCLLMDYDIQQKL